MKRFFLVDCNNFFVSCERVFNPVLRNKPVAVLSSNDACIIARSNEVKALGVPMGAPLFEYEKLLKYHGVYIYSANFSLYGDMSNRVMQTLAPLATDIEIYSIDEAFLFVSDYSLPITYDPRFYYASYGHLMRKQVMQNTGIPVSVGIGPTKTLAKIANHIVKKNPVYDGVFDITLHPDKDTLLQAIEVGDVWGIGRRYAKALRKKGVSTAYDFMQLDDAWVRKNMSVVGLKTLHELRGVACLDLDESHDSKQSICVSRLFGQKTKNIQDVHEALAHYTSMAAIKLRAQKSVTAHISVFLMTSRHHDPYTFFKSASIPLPIATAYTPTLIAQAQQGLQKIIIPGLVYKKVGVVLSDIEPESSIQLSTYVAEIDIEREKKLMHVVDQVNKKMGKNKLFFAAAGVQQQWKMKQEKRSQLYTTSWNELLTIKV